MRRLLSILTASLIMSSMLVAPAYAKDKGEKGGPDGPGASESAPGNAKGDGQNASGLAPGQAKGDGQSAKGQAPGQAGAGSTAPQLAGVKAGTRANVVEVNDFLKGKRRSALNKSLAANQAGIDRLRSNLVRLRLSGLNARDAGDAIATRREPDGSVTVFVDRGAN